MPVNNFQAVGFYAGPASPLLTSQVVPPPIS